jgi:hypothetical protein
MQFSGAKEKTTLWGTVRWKIGAKREIFDISASSGGSHSSTPGTQLCNP